MNLSSLFRIRSPLVLGVLLWSAEAALIVQFDPVQGATNTLIDFTITNDDAGTTYESAHIDLELILGPVADFISLNSINPAYAGKTRSEIIITWGANVRAPPSGEVYTDWATIIDGNNNQLIGNDGGTPWTATNLNPDQDLMAITLNLHDSLDLNHNGQFDPETESLVLTSDAVSAFEVETTTGFTIPGTMNTYAVLTPPVIDSVSGMEGDAPTVVEDLAAGFDVTSTEGNFSYSVEDASLDPNKIQINFFYRNPFVSADVETARINLSFLNIDLFSLPQNQFHGNVANMVNSSEYSATLVPGAVENKWFLNPNEVDIAIFHSGLAYDPWETGDQLVLTLNLSKSLFDANGNGWSQAEVEAGIDYALTADTVDSVLGTAYASVFTTFDETGRALRATRFEEVFLSLSDLVPGQAYTVERSGSLDAPDWRAHLTFTASSASEVVKLFVPEEEMGAVFFRVSAFGAGG